MAVENLPVFNSVSKDKLMNIATQVSDIYLLLNVTFNMVNNMQVPDWTDNQKNY